MVLNSPAHPRCRSDILPDLLSPSDYSLLPTSCFRFPSSHSPFFPSSSSSPTMITTLYSVAIFVTDIEGAVAFYRDTLELPLRAQGSFGAEFLEGETKIGVHPASHADAKAMIGRHTGLTFHVPDLLHVCGVLHDRGVQFITEPTQQAWGIMAMIADPDGNILALWEDKLPEDQPEAPPESA